MARKNNREDKFIPYEKQSKKDKRDYDKKKRNDWGATDPVTKVIPDKRKNKKEKHKKDNYYDDYDY